MKEEIYNIELDMQTKEAEDTAEKYLMYSTLFGSYSFTDEQKKHIKEMLTNIYLLKFYKHSAGSFVSACVRKDWNYALQTADNINKKYVGFYHTYVHDVLEPIEEKKQAEKDDKSK